MACTERPTLVQQWEAYRDQTDVIISTHFQPLYYVMKPDQALPVASRVKRGQDYTAPEEVQYAVALAKSIGRAIQILTPWCQVRNSYVFFTHQLSIHFLDILDSTVAGDIAAQALAYFEAINFSVDAAQNGFTAAVEAISLSELIPITSPDQHKSYLAGMLQLAQNGHNNTAKTLQMFRDIHKNVLEVCCLFLYYVLFLIRAA
jgi:hypothetical protein